MSPLPEEEVPTPKRRVWVWLVVGSLVLCLAICVALLVWAQYTPSGRNFQTRIAEETTAEAGE